MHKSIQILDLELRFPHKVCFTEFNTQIPFGSKIAIIGRNGSGKSSLLTLLKDKLPSDVVLGFVPQVIETFADRSGGQRVNSALTEALSVAPNVLMLDEPTNHLDAANRKSLLRLLRVYQGTLIIVSHDAELLNHCVDTLWHIDNGKITVFHGCYADYLANIKQQRAGIELELSQLERDKKQIHAKLMKEQQRAAKSRQKGEKSIEQRKWPTVVSKTKALHGEETSGRKKAAITREKQELLEQLSELRLPEIIVPTFSITPALIGNQVIVAVSDGTVGYDHTVVSEIYFSLHANEKIAITGDNASGKSTVIKALLQDPTVITTGMWTKPKVTDIGYLDQHYAWLTPELSLLDLISTYRPDWSHAEIRRHLNDFLFRKNEEVNCLVANLSGGEKARLSLAIIAAKTPKLLILDEITNNLDLETKQHVIEVLKNYPGAMMVISHEDRFLQEIGVTDCYLIRDGILAK